MSSNHHDELPDTLARALRTLDAESGRAAARVDAGRVAEGVLKQLRQEPGAAPARRWHGGALRVAAAAVVLVMAGTIAQRLAMNPVVGAGREGAVSVPIGADSLDAGQATALLAALDQVPAGVTDTVATTVTRSVSVDDLSEAELRTLLRIMDSAEETR